MKKRGRPTKLNTELIRQSCDLFREGFGITTVCAALHVSESKFHEWMSKGEQGEQPYAEFRQRTLCARAWGKIEHLRRIFASKDWRGRAWYLERTHPLEFGRTVERPLPPRPPEPPPDLSGRVKLQFPDGFMEQVLEENARLVNSLLKVLPAGTLINPYTGVITMRDGTVISPDGSEPQSKQSESETDE